MSSIAVNGFTYTQYYYDGQALPGSSAVCWSKCHNGQINKFLLMHIVITMMLQLH